MDEARHARARGHLRTTITLGAIMLVALGLVLVLGGESATDEAEPPPPVEPVESQETLLIQVEMERVSLVSAIAAVPGETAPAAWMPAGSHLLVADGAQYSSLLEVSNRPGRSSAPTALTGTLGVAVEPRWLMERKALAALVDAVGGVTVQSDRPLTFTDEFGEVQLQLPPGTSELAGRAASWYVSGFIADETSNLPQLARFHEVFHAVLPGLPQDQDTLVQLLTSLGALSDTNVPRADLAEFLQSYRVALDADAVTQVELTLRAPQSVEPVSEVEEPQPVGEEALDLPVIAPVVAKYTASTPELRAVFRESPRTAEETGAARVVVWTRDALPPESLASALGELEDAGFVVVSGGRWAAAAGADSTTDISPDGDTIINGRGHDQDGQAWALQVSEALVVPAATLLGDTEALPEPPDGSDEDAPGDEAEDDGEEPALMPEPDTRPLGDVDVVLGADYRGCQRDGSCLEEESQP